jgi:hypothetical protein
MTRAEERSQFETALLPRGSQVKSPTVRTFDHLPGIIAFGCSLAIINKSYGGALYILLQRNYRRCSIRCGISPYTRWAVNGRFNNNYKGSKLLRRGLANISGRDVRALVKSN